MKTDEIVRTEGHRFRKEIVGGFRTLFVVNERTSPGASKKYIN